MAEELKNDPVLTVIRELSVGITELRNDIQELTKVIRDSTPTAHNVIVYRDIPREHATNEILELMQSADQEMYASEISETLRIDYDLVTEVLKDLRAQGKV